MTDPLTFDACLSLGRELLSDGRPAEAAVPLGEAVRLRPGDGPAQHALGLALHRCGDPAAAADAFRAAIAADPAGAEPLVNLASSLYELGRPAEAVVLLEQAFARRPNLATARYMLGLCLLALGDWGRGWPLFEDRRRVLANPTADLRPLPPAWTVGQHLSGRTLLVVCEGGLGNTFQFIRYVPVLARRAGPAGRVVVHCQPPLRAVLAGVDGIAAVVTPGEPVPAADYHVLTMSLPAALGTRPETVPRDVSYLRADPVRVDMWKRRLAGPGFKVGVAWQGNRRFPSDYQRSLPLAAFEPLARVAGVRLFSLQKGHGIDQLAGARRRFSVETFDPPLEHDAPAFVDTAAAMANLDLVVTSDTSIAHLAGALGVRTWVALSVGCDWRWMRDRADTPWYPTMRLFRQTKPGDWPGVFARMADALRAGLRPAPAPPAPPARRPPVLVPTSLGELLDRLTILQIKAERLTDPEKLRPIRAELAALTDVRQRSLPRTAELDALTCDLRQVNETLWQIEDDLRSADAAGDYGPRFVDLARSVYRTNDRRSALKRQVNVLLGSALRDEKQYPLYER